MCSQVADDNFLKRIAKVNKQGMADNRTQRNASRIGVHTEFPPAPVIVENGAHGIRAAVHREGSGVVNELPVFCP